MSLPNTLEPRLLYAERMTIRATLLSAALLMLPFAADLPAQSEGERAEIIHARAYVWDNIGNHFTAVTTRTKFPKRLLESAIFSLERNQPFIAG